jgi:hypothetical protein
LPDSLVDWPVNGNAETSSRQGKGGAIGVSFILLLYFAPETYGYSDARWERPEIWHFARHITDMGLTPEDFTALL